MNTLRIDIETYCDLDLPKVGVYKYVQDPSFEVLMAAYKINDQPTKLIDFMLSDPADYDYQMMLGEFRYYLLDPEGTKKAFNANFERTALAKFMAADMPPEQWSCTMIHGVTLGLPGSLAKMGDALNMDADKQKDKAGKELIKFFCKPCKPTKKNGQRTRNLPEHDLERWKLFKEYCIQDVEAELAIEQKISGYPVMESERKLWDLDQRINDAGVLLDRDLVNKAVEFDEILKSRVREEIIAITGVTNPNSDAQLKDWIADNTDVDARALGLNKKSIPKMLEETNDMRLVRVLDLRNELNKTSNAKYHTMARCISSDDDRARGLLQFYGAKTGRWGGRLVQVQNLPQNKIKDLDRARELLKHCTIEGLDLLYPNTANILSQLIRTAFIPEPGKLFYVSDFSAIEARVIAWVAGESWRMDVFNTHGKIYEASASQMFNVDLDTIAKGKENYALRAKGKIAELALGYGGAKGALEQMGALDMGLSQDELAPLVKAWRKANPNIVDFWWAVGDSATAAVRTPGLVTETHGLRFICENGYMFITLPSGRKLGYAYPTVEPGRYGKDQLFYWGMDQVKGKWSKIDTYGPKLVENIIQAIARDCLAEAMIRLDEANFKMVMHVHDEVIIEHDAETTIGTNVYTSDMILETIGQIMSRRPVWAQDLPLGADGYHCRYYQKD